MKRLLLAPLLFAACAPAAELAQAQEQYDRTEYREALKLLNLKGSQNPAELLLAGKSLFATGEFKKAVEILHRAAALEPSSSPIQHWLGKSYGRLAETSSFFTAPGHASNCRKAFEKAVALDGKNILAMNDLFEYYLEAPGFLGGGLDKAEALATRIGELDPAEQHYALAKLAEKRRDPKDAEQQLRHAVQAAPQQVGRLIDLAQFLARQGRHQESDKTFQQAERIAPGAPVLLFQRASTLIQAKRNLPEARHLLEQYLQAPLTPDDPPRAEAKKLLEHMSGV
ncbi:MAG: hypothetical protein ABI972_04210 [Acidobacteriota bacterium]